MAEGPWCLHQQELYLNGPISGRNVMIHAVGLTGHLGVSTSILRWLRGHGTGRLGVSTSLLLTGGLSARS